MKVINKNLNRNYKVFDKFEAGLVLTGEEAKAAKFGKVDINKAYVKIVQNEAYLINANFFLTGGKQNARTKKLLLHKHEIVSLLSKMKSQGAVLMPVKIYTKKKRIKLEVALSRGKKKYDKRSDIKKTDIKNQAESDLREAKNKVKRS